MGTTTQTEALKVKFHYIIPRNKWELQPFSILKSHFLNYIIPRNKWELQL